MPDQSILESNIIKPTTTDGSLTLQGDSLGAGVTGLVIDSTGTVTTGTLGSGVVFPTGHMIFRELQSETQPNSQTGLTATNVATTLSVTPLYATSKFIFNVFGACSVGASTLNLGGQILITPKYSLNSDMSSSTSGNYARAHYFNNDSPSAGQDIVESAGSFYSSTVITHGGNAHYFNVDLTLISGYRGLFRDINMQIIEVF